MKYSRRNFPLLLPALAAAVASAQTTSPSKTAGSKRTSYSHVKAVLAGLLATDSQLRAQTMPLYLKGDDKGVMDRLHEVGVPAAVTIDDLRPLFEVVFLNTKVFPLPLDYDQDNCNPPHIISAAVTLDTSALG